MLNRQTFKDAQRGRLYEAAEFNRLKNTVSRLTAEVERLHRNMLHVRHAITHDGGGTYPPFGDHPDTYAIKWVHLTYDAEAGDKGHVLSYWDGASVSPVHDDEPDDFVHNIAQWGQLNDLYSPYIPEGTLIKCYYQNGAWFTDWWDQTTVYRGELTAEMEATDEEGTMDSLMPLDGPDLGLSTITFKNIFGDAGVSGAIVEVIWNSWLKQWELLQIIC